MSLGIVFATNILIKSSIMKELIEKITSKVGITPEQATNTINAVAEYVKDKLPVPFHKAIDSALNGESLGDGIKAQIEGLGGNILETAEELKGKAEEFGENLKDKLSGLFGGDKK